MSGPGAGYDVVVDVDEEGDVSPSFNNERSHC